MRFPRMLLIAGTAASLGLGSAFAADTGKTSKAKSDDPGFNNLDKNHDGKLTRAEAARNPYLEKRFKEADRNGDGTRSRTEYLRVMTAKDLGTAREKVSGGKKEPSASAGGTKSSSSKSSSTKSRD
jgi:hypothetical protein